MKMMNHPRLLFNVFTAETVSGRDGWGLWEATVIAFHLSIINYQLSRKERVQGYKAWEN